MDKISSERIASYQATLYRVTGIVPAFTLRIGEYSAALATVYRDTGHVNAAYITAWNPRSQPFPNDINEDRQRRLIACLEERGNRWVADVKHDKGVDFIDITTIEDPSEKDTLADPSAPAKSLKTASSKRAVPIIGMLIDAGFLDYVTLRRTQKGAA